LPCGDYRLPGFEDRAAIERKSLNYLVGCLKVSNRDRFERELVRGGHYELFTVVVEGSLADVSQDRYKSEMKPHSAMQSIIAFQVRYRVPFLWCGSWAGAEYMTYSLPSKYLREIGEQYKLATQTHENVA
jgi:ERCC4-type nuclease